MKTLGEDLASKEASVFWFGDADDLDAVIISFIKNYKNNRFGVTFAQLENYLVYNKNLCTTKRLINHLRGLQRHKMLRHDICRGLKFYKVIK